MERTAKFKTAQIVVRLDEDNTKSSLPKRLRDSIVSYEEYEYDNYPFHPSKIEHKNVTFLLKEHLNCIIEYKRGKYFISFSPLGISVWGKSREEAEEAYGFIFYSLYTNYYLAKNSELTADAISLKKRFKGFIKEVADEIHITAATR